MLNAILISMLCFFARADVKEAIYDEYEGIVLAEALIRDGKFAEANAELKKIKGTDRVWQAYGGMAMAAGDPKAALGHYKKVGEPLRRALLSARALYDLKDFRSCAANFAASADLWLQTQTDVIAKAACEYRDGRIEAAWDSLARARAAHDNFALQREMVSLQLELKLDAVALKTAVDSGQNRSTAEWLGLAELFLNKKDYQGALALVEVARAQEPFDLDANLSAAQVYFQMGDLGATAESFERASRVDRKYAYHASELNRQLGRRELATYFAQLIPESKDRLKSRMALYVETNRYPLIASMEAMIGRSTLKDDDEMRYALAYSLLRQGDLDRSLVHLNRIRRPEFLEKTSLLKKAALDCKAGLCRL